MRVVFMGTPEFAVATLCELVLNRHQVVAVYTRTDRAAGRGLKPVSSAVKRAALRANLPVVQPASFRKAEAVAQLVGLHPEVIVVAAYGQILPPSVLDIPRYGCINVHPSLLPRHRGASPVIAAILAGDDFTGVSIMLMDPGLDSGPVLTRTQIPVSPWDTTGSLTAKLSLVGAQLLQEVLLAWPRGELAPQPQNEAEATYSGTVSKEAGRIDWQLPVVTIWRRVRAFQPWPGSYTRWQGRMLKIIKAMPLAAAEAAEIGQVIALPPSREGAAFGIATGDGVLGVLRVQLEGKRAMSSAEFLRGQRQLIGAVLPLS